MKSLIPILLPVVLIFTAFIPAKNTSIKDFEWLIGRWENQSNNYSYSEEWIKVNSNELSGKRLFIHNKDTLYYDKMYFTEQDGNLVYYEETLIPAQMTNKLSPPYTIQQVSAKSITIENAGYDALIKYNLPNPDLLVVELTDSDGNTKLPEAKFNLKKVKY